MRILTSALIASALLLGAADVGTAQETAWWPSSPHRRSRPTRSRRTPNSARMLAGAEALGMATYPL